MKKTLVIQGHSNSESFCHSLARAYEKSAKKQGHQAPGLKIMRKSTLEFCGVKVTGEKIFGPIRNSTDSQRQKWLESL